VRRFLAHVLPTGIKRIRHYGVLASSCKRVKLSAARTALQMPLPNPQAMESVQGFMVRVVRIDVSLCPCCKVGRLHVIAVLQGQARLATPACAVAQHSRGAAMKWGHVHGLTSQRERLGVRLGVRLRVALDTTPLEQRNTPAQRQSAGPYARSPQC